MSVRYWLLGAALGAVVLGAAVPAHADDDHGWNRGRGGWDRGREGYDHGRDWRDGDRGRDWRDRQRHEEWEHRAYEERRGYIPPAVVYRGAPSYYRAPPIVFGVPRF